MIRAEVTCSTTPISLPTVAFGLPTLELRETTIARHVPARSAVVLSRLSVMKSDEPGPAACGVT
jgi:hypothetical protein